MRGNVFHLPAIDASDMITIFRVAVELLLKTSKLKLLNHSKPGQSLKNSINAAKAVTRQLFANFFINLIRSRMPPVLSDSLEYNLPLAG